jgi:hypothetical protein
MTAEIRLLAAYLSISRSIYFEGGIVSVVLTGWNAFLLALFMLGAMQLLHWLNEAWKRWFLKRLLAGELKWD